MTLTDEITQNGAEEHFSRGLKALREGNSLAALSCFEKACALDNSPPYSSYYGLCVAKERGQVQRGMLLCREAIQQDPDNPVHYLNLGRIHLVGGNKQETLRVLRQGLGHGHNEEILALLDSIGMRKSPVLPFLGRDNRINKYLGILLTRLRLR